MEIKIFQIVCLSILFFTCEAQDLSILAHSHNDYEQEEPLAKALSHDFKSIEVDIFEYNGKIVVSHDDENLDSKPSLKELYLDPLSDYSFSNGQSIFLLIDLKMEGQKILNTLHKLLKSYSHIIKDRRDKTNFAPIQILLSGSVDADYVISSESYYYFYIDGRVNHLENNYDSKLMPLISSDIEDLICWKPSKKITKDFLKPILDVIHKSHQQGKLIRFWNTSEDPQLWDLLISMKVDLIGVDDIEKFVEYSTKF